MSRLEFYSRPLVAFDAHNKEHRRYFAEYLKTRAWGRCPVRFIVPDAAGSNLIKVIEDELVAYYVGKEFKVEARRD